MDQTNNEISPQNSNKSYLRYIIIAGLLIIILSMGFNFYLFYKTTKIQKEIVDIKSSANKDPRFEWVSKYIEIKEGEIPWQDCGEEKGQCAFWEDYSGQTPLPRVFIKECPQQGTHIENGNYVTGLPIGEQVIIGATIRPCVSGIQGESTELLDNNNQEFEETNKDDSSQNE